MKVLFITRNTLFTVSGGDTVQVLETAAHLRELGIETDVKTTGEVTDYSKYDLLHFFNIIRPADILPHITKTTLPFVVSTIFVDYSEFDKTKRKGLSGLILRLLHFDAVEYVKNILRSVITGQDKVSLRYVIAGHKKSLLYIAGKATRLLPNSKNEFNRLQQRYGINNSYSVIPNGVNTSLFGDNITEQDKDPFLVVCAARIEGIKNQLMLIEALNNTPFKLLLIGDAAPNQISYYKLCKQKAGANIEFIHQLPQHELKAYYKKAKVHVLPSWFETTGLSSLEAAVMGCNIVVTNKGDVKDYFGEHAYYCDPASPESIRKTIEIAASSPLNPKLSIHIREHFTWQKAAEQTAKVYREILQ